MSSETDKVVERYERRKNNPLVNKNAVRHSHFKNFVRIERENAYTAGIKNAFPNLEKVKLLEIGAGTGDNLFLFNSIGLKADNIFANELLQDRLETLKKRFPRNQVLEGDALAIDENMHSFDIIFQGTVFTSILDAEFKKKLASKMWSLLNSNGLILWYDFAFDNPKNKDVKGVKRSEVKELFPEAENVVFKKITLAPPIGRKVGRLYPLFNAFTFLRTHLVAEIRKK